MEAAKTNFSLQLDLYFQELEAVQAQVMEILGKQQASLATPVAQEIQTLAEQQASAVEQLQNLINRRAQLLNLAKSSGLPADNLRELAAQVKDSNDASLKKGEQLQLKMLALHRSSQSVWVAAQKAALHYGQLVQFIANGGRRPLISSTGKPHHQGGAILDASV